jgi:aquaporin Z
MIAALEHHWPEYLMEAAGLGIFMISAGLFGTFLEHPNSLLRQSISDPFLRRLIMGVLMGLTAIGIIYSPWGKQSGAHINPSVTVAFFRLGKVKGWDTLFYVAAQFAGGVGGVLVVSLVLGSAIAHPSVNYVATVPGAAGVALAFAAEFVIAFILMVVILAATNTQSLARYTGFFAGILIATYITFEAPLSGMSINPARTFGSAVSARLWTALWLYFTAPILGMLAAAQVYLWGRGAHRISCAKLHHQNNKRCIHCGENL